MLLPIGPAVQLLAGGTLLLLAATLVLAGRRRVEGVVLSVFLTLVGTNLVAGALLWVTVDIFWARVGFLVLAFDPFFLLLFVSLYPYRRFSLGIVCALAGTLAAGLAAVFLMVFRPEGVVASAAFVDPRSAMSLLLISQLVVGYLMGWLAAIESRRSATTPLLTRRSNWLILAVGVAVLSRLARVPEELSLYPGWMVGWTWRAPPAWQQPAVLTIHTLTGFVIVATLALIGTRRLRGTATSSIDGRNPIVLAAWISVLLIVVGNFLILLADVSDSFVGSVQIAWSARWPVFAVLLVHGMLSYELLDFPSLAPKAVGILGATWAALVGFMIVAQAADAAGASGFVSAILGTVGAVGLARPGRSGARALVNRFAPGPLATSAADRRLELYRAALETAWARGPPPVEARRRLEKERRAFGVTPDEARVLEHVVASGAPNSERALAPGDEPLPGVLIEGLLGEGSHGLVFAARQVPSRQTLVVKEFRLDRGGASGARQRLLRELRPVQALQHPRIVRLLDVHAVPGRYLLLYEHVDGQPLSRLLEAGPLPPAKAAQILHDLLEALAAAHAAGVVHRDVKPSNILVDRHGRAHLTDFGVATVWAPAGDVRATVTNLDAVGVAAGTLAYMAPEQLRNGPVGPATDLYQAGLVLFEMLAGRPALDVRGHDVVEAMERVARPRIPLDVVAPAWREVLARALEAEPGRRFPSAGEMARAVADVERDSARPG